MALAKSNHAELVSITQDTGNYGLFTQKCPPSNNNHPSKNGLSQKIHLVYFKIQHVCPLHCVSAYKFRFTEFPSIIK